MTEPTPELRSRLIGEILQHVASVPHPVTYDAIFERALASSGLTEEEVSHTILHSVSHLVLSGLLQSDMFDAELQELTFASNTTVVAGPRLLGLIWDEDLPCGENDEEDA